MPSDNSLLSFERLFWPHTLDEALKLIASRTHWAVQRTEQYNYLTLMPPAELWRILEKRELTADDIAVVDDTIEVSSEDYCTDAGEVDATRVNDLHCNGATVSFRRVQRYLHGVNQLCLSAEKALGCRFQANAYLTPPGAQGFKTHLDTHDIFVLQIAGQKTWRLYGQVVMSPLPGQAYYWEQSPEADLTDAVHLRPGDLLYVKSGIPHDARALGGEVSIHLTLGALTRTWADFLIEIIADVALRDPTVRDALPRQYATRAEGAKLFAAKLPELLERVRELASPEAVHEVFAEQFVRGSTILPAWPAIAGSLADVTMETRLWPPEHLVFRIREEPQCAVIQFGRKELRAPNAALGAIKHSLTSDGFTGEELPGPLSEASKLRLLRRLLREGLLVMA